MLVVFALRSTLSAMLRNHYVIDVGRSAPTPLTFPTEHTFLIPMGPRKNRSFVQTRINCLIVGQDFLHNSGGPDENWLEPATLAVSLRNELAHDSPVLPPSCSWRPLHEDDDSNDESKSLWNATHCSHAGLTAFPDNLPTNVQELLEPFSPSGSLTL